MVATSGAKVCLLGWEAFLDSGGSDRSFAVYLMASVKPERDYEFEFKTGSSTWWKFWYTVQYQTENFFLLKKIKNSCQELGYAVTYSYTQVHIMHASSSSKKNFNLEICTLLMVWVFLIFF